MPYVAAAKHRDGVPITDPAQEARVLERVRQEAGAHGLNADTVTELFRTLIDAAKAIEASSTAPPESTAPSLADLRVVLAGVSDQLIAELQRTGGSLHDTNRQAQVAAVAQTGLADSGVDRAMITRITTALGRIDYAHSSPTPSPPRATAPAE
jgi:chorismate mutase-like protein